MTLSNRVGLILALSFTVSCSIVSMKRKQTDDSQELDRDNKTVLIRAAEEGDIEQVQELIEDTNTKINAQDIYKRTALMHAIIHGHYEIVQVLLEHNADKEHLDYFGLTPLLLAIQNQQKEIVDLLLKHRADITSPMTTHLPIETAAAFNYLEIVKVLLAHGALVNPINFYQTPALTSAASHGHREMAAFLLNQGAFINTVDRENKSALSHAIEKGHKEVAALLLQRGAPSTLEQLKVAKKVHANLSVNGEKSPWGTSQADYAFIIHLLELYEEPSFKQYLTNPLSVLQQEPAFNDRYAQEITLPFDTNGLSLSMLAALCDHRDIIHILKSYNISSACLNAQSKAGYTTLDYAILTGNFDFAATYIEAFGQQLTQLATEGQKLLTLAVEKKLVKFTITLLKSGVNPELYARCQESITQLEATRK